MPARICIIQGHPDTTHPRFCHALAAAYGDAAMSAGREVRTLSVGDLDFPLLRSRAEWTEGPVADAIREAQHAIAWAEHLVVVYPLWLGGMPALLRAFIEQVMRPGFAVPHGKAGLNAGLLKGRSARIIVTMGMPAFVYRIYFRAHSLRALERNILRFVGIAPVRSTLIGMVEGSHARREKGLKRVAALGRGGR